VSDTDEVTRVEDTIDEVSELSDIMLETGEEAMVLDAVDNVEEAAEPVLTSENEDSMEELKLLAAADDDAKELVEAVLETDEMS